MTLPAFGNLVQSAPDKRLHAFEIEPYITIPDVKQALVSSADPHGRTTIDGTPYELNWSRIDESALYRAADGRSHTPFEVLRLLYVPPDKIVYWPTGYFVFKDKRTEDLIYFCVEGTGRDDLSLRMASDPEQEYLLGEMAAIERLDDEQASA